MAPTVYTIGHSTRSLDELLALLAEQRIALLIDVRRHPGSRRHPHFSRAALAPALERAGVAYVHAPELGGRRQPQPDSPNTAWRSTSFRAYADHMQSVEFGHALARLLDQAGVRRAALMCAEAVPWRCHRQLIADYLVAQGHRVLHILGPRQLSEHRLNPAARRLDRERIVYPAGDQAELF